MQRKLFGFLGLVSLGAFMLGCGGGPKYVPVSGVVTLDGKPYSKAVVSFQPQASGSNIAPGRGSSAFTDASGRFVLKSDDAENGAVVGKHIVRIATKLDDIPDFDPELGSPDGDVKNPSKAKRHDMDPIGAEWNTKSEKVFEVPAGGTDKADFSITSAKGAKKK